MTLLTIPGATPVISAEDRGVKLVTDPSSMAVSVFVFFCINKS